jgi:molybdate transport system substrate-binding protein
MELKIKIDRKRGINIKALVLLVFTLFIPFSCKAAEIKLSTAVSLKEALTDLSGVFAKDHPGVTFQINAGASGTLAKQIENGAPADIFFSANLEWMDYLKDKGLVEGKNIGVFAYNVLVFIGRPDLKVTALKDLASLEKIAIASPKSAPAGEYAMAALSNAGVDRLLEKKLVMAKDVRECIMYVERSEVDGAFAYQTDAQQTDGKLKVLLKVPQDLYPRVTYPMGLTASGAKNEEARAFFKFLQSGTAKAVLSRYGFIVEK